LLNDTEAARHANEVLDVDAALSDKKTSTTVLDSNFIAILSILSSF